MLFVLSSSIVLVKDNGRHRYAASQLSREEGVLNPRRMDLLRRAHRCCGSIPGGKVWTECSGSVVALYERAQNTLSVFVSRLY